MRILIATHHLASRAGTEVYVLTVAEALVARGHDVVVYSPFPGSVSGELVEAGIPFADELASLSGERFSVAHVHHNIVATQVRSRLPDVPMVWVRHGTLPPLEQPPTFVPEVVLAVAPDRALELSRDCGLEVEVVANPVDTERFSPTRRIAASPRRALILSNYSNAHVRAAIEGACEQLGIRLTHVGLPENSRADVHEALDDADLVFAIGRSALEAGAMARAVLLYDMHGFDGWLDHANYDEAFRCGFSGRARGTYPTSVELADVIAAEYSVAKGTEAQEVVRARHALDVVLPELERHYRRAMARGMRDEPLPLPRLGLDLAGQLAYYQRQLQHGEWQAREIQRLRKEVELLRADGAAGPEELERLKAELELLRAQLDDIACSRPYRIMIAARRFDSLLYRLTGKRLGRRATAD